MPEEKIISLSNYYIKKTDIANDLTTTDSTKVLSAQQGKILNDLIGQAIEYINR